jgi:hypothetical protein
MKLHIACVVAAFLSPVLSLTPRTIAQTFSQNASALPRLVRLGGTVKDLNGSPLTGVVGITFALYSERTGGAALWLETQNITVDSNGHYTVMLGATKLEGVPAELFASEQAQWLGVQPQGQAEQPRVMLVSVPYALKAGDAETLGGKPASAYALAVPQTGTSAPASEGTKANGAISPSNNNQSSTSAATTGSGTTNYIPRWTSSSALGNSNIFQNATNKDIGIGTTTPTATLDVKGTTLLNGGSTSAFGLTVSSPAQLGEEIQGPVTGVGAGLDFKTTGAGGKQWEILATGNTSSQGAGQLNIRDINTNTDVFTIDAVDLVGVNVGLIVHGPATTTNPYDGQPPTVGIQETSSFNPLEIHSAHAVGIDIYTHQSNSSQRAPELNLLRSRGTQTAPTAVQAADQLGFIFALGYDGREYASPCGIQAEATQNWSVGANGMAWGIGYIPNNSTNCFTGITIDQTGFVGIGNLSIPHALFQLQTVADESVALGLANTAPTDSNIQGGAFVPWNDQTHNEIVFRLRDVNSNLWTGSIPLTQNGTVDLTATSAAFATATTAGTCVQSTTAVTGAATSMVAYASPVSTPGVGAQWSAFVSSAGNVTINECAVATSAGGTIVFNIRVKP